MKSIEERAYKKSLELFKPNANVTTKELLIEMAKEQQKVDIEKFADYAKRFNQSCEELGMKERIDVDSMRKWASFVILGNDTIDSLGNWWKE